jgi:hypothetical protein
MMDMLRHLAMAYRYMDIRDISFRQPDTARISSQKEDDNVWDYDPLGRKKE